MTQKPEFAKTAQVPELAVIESDVPEPSRCFVSSYGVEIDLRQTIKNLQPGQSFVVDSEKARRKALDMGYSLNINVKTRKLPDARFRIWRRTK